MRLVWSMVAMPNAPQQSAGMERPEWLRPKQVPQHFGIGKSLLYELIAEGKIKTVSMRRRGAKHGTRLISFDSLAAYLESLATPASNS